VEKDEVTEPNVSVELEAAADVLLALWRQLREDEKNLRAAVVKARTEGRPAAALVAQMLRKAADHLIERAGKLHDTARRIEPPLPGRRRR